MRGEKERKYVLKHGFSRKSSQQRYREVASGESLFSENFKKACGKKTKLKTVRNPEVNPELISDHLYLEDKRPSTHRQCY